VEEKSVMLARRTLVAISPDLHGDGFLEVPMAKAKK